VNILVIFAAALLCGCSSIPRYHYMARGAERAAAIAPAPLQGSAEDKADMEVLLQWQNRRTAAQCAAAKSQYDGTFEQMFGDISPFPLTPQAAEFLNRVGWDAGLAAENFKQRYKRPRPFNRPGGPHSCIGWVGGYAYPSGHATLSRVFALLLCDVAPERREQFMARADEAALYRVISGVHHPSDIAAGKELGAQVYARLLEAPGFASGLEMLRGLAAKR